MLDIRQLSEDHYVLNRPSRPRASILAWLDHDPIPDTQLAKLRKRQPRVCCAADPISRGRIAYE